MGLKNEGKQIVGNSSQPNSEGLNQTEKLMLRTLVSDRIENRFQYATKLSQEMNIEGLASCVDEIRRLQVIGGKLR